MALSILNFDFVQLEGARRRVDVKWREISDQLDDAYYGTPQFVSGVFTVRLSDGWKHGVSHPFFIWDVQVTPEKSKLAFDLLTGILGHLLFLVQHLFNCDHKLVNPAVVYDKTSEEEYNVLRDEAGIIIESKVKREKRWLRNMATTWNGAALQPPMTKARAKSIVDKIRAIPAVAEAIARRPGLDVCLDPDNEIDVT